MNTHKKILTAVLLGATLAGCAHKPVQTAGLEPTSLAVREQTKAKTYKISPVQPAEDLASILRGSVLRFDFDRAELNDDNQKRLVAVGEALRSHPKAVVKISGHCDERGTQEYNLALGQRRAEVARRYLMALGVAPERVLTVSFGSELPISHGHDEQAWAQNRRGEVTAGQ